MTMPQRIAFIGLGAMGFPMAGHLAKTGHNVTVFNRTAERASAWQAEYGGQIAATPAKAAEHQDAVMICVGNDDDVLAVTTGDEGALKTLAEGALLIDHTTTSETLAISLAEIASESGVAFLDAPVSGGQIGAENGVLTVMAGGDETAFQSALPLLECYAKSVKRMGPVGAGQLTKMVNQICIAGVVQGLAEGLNFAIKAGLEGEELIETLSKGAAGSWQMENRYQTMLQDQYEFGFAVDWMRKDLGIALAEAGKNGAELPVTALVDSFYQEVQAAGGGRWDTSSLLTRYTRPK